MLFTSNAIGWNIDRELREIERVVKPGGQACILIQTERTMEENPVHKTLISGTWNYGFSETFSRNSRKMKYVKTIT